jgi:UDP-glucose 4-epimerase
VDDVVEATILAMENANAVGEVFNIGSGISTSVNELAKTIQDLAGCNLQTVYEEPRLGDIKRSFANIDKARKTLGYNPRITLRQGLKTLLSKSVRKPYRLKGQ